MHLLKIRFTVFLMILMGVHLMSSDLRKWELATTLPGETLSDVCWGKGLFITVAEENQIFYSSDGRHWTQANTVAVTLSNVTYQRDTFFAMGPGIIARSPDGINWTSVSNTGATAISCHKNMLIAVGSNGDIQQSTDGGLTWQAKNSGTTKNLMATTHWNGYFYAVGEHQTVLISFNGSLWEQAHQDTSAGNFNSVLPWDGAILAFGDDQKIFRSFDAWNWSPRISQGFEGFSKVRDFGGLLAARDSGGMAFSPDGSYWSSLDFHQPPDTPNAMATNGDTWIAVFSTGEIYISQPDHLNRWVSLNSRTGYELTDAIWDGTKWIVTGTLSLIKSVVGTSIDGSHWDFQILQDFNIINGIAYGNGYYVIVGAYGDIWTSTDAFNWSPATNGTTESFHDVAFNGSLWVAVGDNGTIFSTTNPTTWNPESSGTTTHLRGVTVDSNGLFWAVGYAGVCVVRDSGGTWSPKNIPTPLDMMAITGTDGASLWAAGESGVLYHFDGSTWSSKYSGTSENFQAISWSAAHGVAIVGEKGVISRFQTYSDHAAIQSFTDEGLNAIASNSVSLLAAGNNGNCGKTEPTAFDQPETVMELTRITSTVKDILWTGELFVAVHSGNRIETSIDGRNWEYRSTIPGQTMIYNDLHWDGQKLYALTYKSIYVTQDFTNWTGGTHNLGFNTFGMTSHNGHFVVTGDWGNIAFGPDINHLSTTLLNDPNFPTFLDVAWNGVQYIAYGIEGIYGYSADGINWATDYFSASGLTRGFASRDDGVSVMTTDHGEIIYSPNGLSYGDIAWLGSPIYEVIWTGEAFIAIGDDGLIFSSSEGMSWTIEDRGYTGAFTSLAWNGHELLAGGYEKVGTKGKIIRFPMASGYQWGKRKSQTNHDVFGTAFNGTHYVSVGLNGRIHVSSNGIEWCEVTSPTSSTLNDIEWIGDRFLAVGSNGKIISSPDGVQWTIENSNTTIRFNCLAFNDKEVLVAAGENGSVIRSIDRGENWSISTDLPFEVNGLAWRNRLWVAVGENGMIESSFDGSSWFARNSGTGQTLQDVCETKYGFLAVGYGGVILESTDSVVWTIKPPFVTTQALKTVKTFGDQIMVGSTGGIWLGNYHIWNFHQVYAGDRIYDLLKHEQWLAVGERGTTLVSTWGTSSDLPIVHAENDNMLVCPGGDVDLVVLSRTPSTFQYRWFKAGIELSPGTEHTSTFTINNFSVADEGPYTCRVWNSGGMTEVAFTMTLSGGFGTEIEQSVYVQGRNPISMTALVTCDFNPIQFSWTELGTQQTFGNGNNPVVLPASVVSSTTVEVSVTDTVTLDTSEDTAFVLIANNPMFFNLNGDNCNDLQDLYNALEEWRQPSSLDANSDGQFNLLDFLYINLDGTCN